MNWEPQLAEGCQIFCKHITNRFSSSSASWHSFSQKRFEIQKFLDNFWTRLPLNSMATVAGMSIHPQRKRCLFKRCRDHGAEVFDTTVCISIDSAQPAWPVVGTNKMHVNYAAVALQLNIMNERLCNDAFQLRWLNALAHLLFERREIEKSKL